MLYNSSEGVCSSLSLSLTLTPSKGLTLQSAGWVLAVSIGNVERERQRKSSGLILNISTHYSWAYSCLIDKRPREFILKKGKNQAHILHIKHIIVRYSLRNKKLSHKGIL